MSGRSVGFGNSQDKDPKEERKNFQPFEEQKKA